MGNQYEIRQIEPFVVRWGAAIPIRPGEWKALQDKTAFLWRPGQTQDDPEVWFHGYYMGLVRSSGVIEFPNLSEEDARIERAGEFLCIQSGGKMWCPRFPPLPPPRTGLEKLFRGLAEKLVAARMENYDAFVAMLGHLAPHLENALLYIADEESFLDRLVISDGVLKRTRACSGRWCPLSSFPESQLPDEKAAESDDSSPPSSPPRRT